MCRNGRLAAVAIPGVALLLLVGALVRVQVIVFPLVPCDAHIYANGAAVPEPRCAWTSTRPGT
ncbi:hypothetical protein [Tersicoccus sp. Bi-70]|uniref:hypothetical protein n=1 Tax=Tersicoccus sp. Bi-70 TaxID=1897634 RepID=UPI00097692E9|nr:hypothetical protein [Tersicoccus sp. Bi-70]OMH36955.1 hypothetical protein BGP79_14640 [Tersicoccus sp. Bi-70]